MALSRFFAGARSFAPKVFADTSAAPRLAAQHLRERETFEAMESMDLYDLYAGISIADR